MGGLKQAKMWINSIYPQKQKINHASKKLKISQRQKMFSVDDLVRKIILRLKKTFLAKLGI